MKFGNKIFILILNVLLFTFLNIFAEEELSELSLALHNLAFNVANIPHIPPIEKKKPIVIPAHWMSFDEWAAKCDELPFFRISGKVYDKAIELDQLLEVKDKFIEVNKAILLESKNWLEDAPSENSEIFTTDKSLEQIAPTKIMPFVQKLEVSTKATVAFHGDFHGDVHSLVAYIRWLQEHGYMEGFKIKDDQDFYLLFLGDYVDRGNYGSEVWYTLMRLKIENPEKVIIVRGNHEDWKIDLAFGFSEELLRKYANLSKQDIGDIPYDIYEKRGYINKKLPPKIKTLTQVYNVLPVCLFLKINKNNLICAHAGLDLNFNPDKILATTINMAFQWLKLDDNFLEKAINTLKDTINPSNLEDVKTSLSQVKQINNFPDNTYNIGFLWSDFNLNETDETDLSKRGTATLDYSKKTVDKFFEIISSPNNSVVGMFRAHQHSIETIPLMITTKTEGQEFDEGILKLWRDDSNKGKDIWYNMVFTFLVGPDSVYGKMVHPYTDEVYKYTYDAFGILTAAENFEDWKFEVIKNNKVFPPDVLAKLKEEQ